MLKKIARFLIITTFQLSVLVLALFFLSPYLLGRTPELLSMAKMLEKTMVLSFLLRLLVYIALFYSWPTITKNLVKNPSIELLKSIDKARFIFMGALLSIEILYWVGKL